MLHIFKIKIMVLTLFVGATAIVTGCVNTPLHTEASTSGIRAAEEEGAAKVPQASLHLQLAKEELDRAKMLSTKGMREEAVSMLSRADADAELALALSLGDTERLDAQAAIERVQKLRKENP